MSESTQQHRKQAQKQGSVAFATVTVSDSRTSENDINGQFLKKQIEEYGHTLSGYRIVADEPDQVEGVLEEFVKTDVQIILFNGGTGISKRDRTFDVLDQKLEKRLSGFGEIFRMLSYEHVGAAAMLSRAVAGTYKDKVIIAIPGSPQAVTLAWEKLIAPEIQHLAWELTR